MSKGNGLVRHYDKLSPEERFRLDVLEMARGDEQESENLEATAESLGLEPDAGRSAEIGAELLETWNAVRRRAA